MSRRLLIGLILACVLAAGLVLLTPGARAAAMPRAATTTAVPALSAGTEQSEPSDVFSSAAPYLLGLLISSGGVFFLIDRRGKKAYELAETASSSTDAIAKHLEIEVERRKDLEQQLVVAQTQLVEAQEKLLHAGDTVAQLRERVEQLERQLEVSDAKISSYEEALKTTTADALAG